MIAIDIETMENNLHSLGPGWHRKDGAVLLIGLYDGKDYVACKPNDPRLVNWLASNEDKVMHNSVYDLSWLTIGYGFKVNGIIHDTMTRAGLIDEYAKLDLDSCCKRFKVKGKNYDDTLHKWASEHGVKDLWKDIDMLWQSQEGQKTLEKYNKQDCIATFDLFEAQELYMPMHEEAYQLECELQPIVQILNSNGFPMDSVARDNFTWVVENKVKEIEEQLFTQYSIEPDVPRSSKKMTEAMKRLGIESPNKTKNGVSSWDAESLGEIDHPCISLIQDSKKLNTLLDNFLKGSLVRGLIDDRIYSVYSPNKRETDGTRTGRFACSHVNMQQIPAREESAQGVKSYGKEMRTLFMPEPGCLLGAADLAGVEMFMFAHYAVGPKSDYFREQARARADFHTMAKELSGLEQRIWAKRLNFTVLYGAGPVGIFKKNKKAFGTLEKTKEIYDKFHKGMPYIRETQNLMAGRAKSVGYVKSLGGRVHHKPKATYDPAAGKINDNLYKMLNSVIQGSCADFLKRGLLDAYNAGVFNVLKLHATVHDENVVSIPYNKEGIEAAVELEKCMTNAYKDKLTVPIFADFEIGPNWGYQKSDIWEAIKDKTFTFDKYKEYVA